MADLLVLGSGLIGTSVALAVGAERDVVLADRRPEALAVAVSRTGCRAWDGREAADLVLAAVPVGAVPTELQRVQRLMPEASLSHVGSVQARVEREVEVLLPEASTFCGGHPMAGREVSGPEGARAQLFAGRTWVVCPTPSTAPSAERAVEELALACGAVPLRRTAEEHDRAVALVSHLPQLVASALAAQLLRQPGDTDLAGPGLQDTTRLAAGGADWWVDVLTANAEHLGPLLRGTAQDLLEVAEALEAGAGAAAAGALLRRGRQGRELVPRKRGAADADFQPVAVDVPDTPGQLAGLLALAAEHGVNVEDVRVDHVPGRPRGTVELLVRPQQAGLLRAALTATGVVVLDA